MRFTESPEGAAADDEQRDEGSHERARLAAARCSGGGQGRRRTGRVRAAARAKSGRKRLRLSDEQMRLLVAAGAASAIAAAFKAPIAGVFFALEVVLNGAFEKHHHRPPYRRSRGLMVLDFFRFATSTEFFEKYNFKGMEPFTFIIVDNGQPYELRWDEKQQHVRPLDPLGFYLWSSATLYPGEVSEMRQQWFRDWRHGRHDFSPAAILDFHRTGGQGDDWNGFIMNREGRVQTVSITQVVKNEGGIELIYNDLLRGAIKHEVLATATLTAPVSSPARKIQHKA